MKHGKIRIVAAGLVSAIAVSTALIAGFVPTNDANQAAAAVVPLTQAAPVVKIVAEPAVTVARTAVRTRTQVAVAPAAARPSTKQTRTAAYQSTKPSTTSELSQARAILAGLIARHPILRGTTVTIGTTPGGYQAVSYYKSGRIVVNPNHTASLSRILNHEIWHIIDWRDNGRIDWGENVPPN